MARAAYTWKPIEDLPPAYAELASPELASLADVWREHRELLQGTDALEIFTERLERKWAIETGIIERVYTLDRGITQLLIERGIDASLIPHDATDKEPELVARLIQDHKTAVEGLFVFVRGNRSLSTSYIKELHSILTRHQETCSGLDQFSRHIEIPLLHGEYKQLPNNPVRENGMIHEYAPPEHVPSEMDDLVALHREHERAGVPPEVESAWFHHRFVQIHPFQDGNGRVARALASLIFIKAGWFPLAVTRDDRLRYIEALEEADRGDLRPLVGLFASIQKRAFVGALSEAGSVLQRQQVDQVIEAARDVFERRRVALRAEWERARDIGVALQADASARFSEVAAKLRREIGAYDENHRFRTDSESFGGPRDHYFRWQIVQTAKSLDYFANTAPGYRAWARLVLARTDTQAELLLSFHGIGHEYRGVLAASMCFYRRETTEVGERQVVDLATVSDEVFQINYRENEDQARARFAEWLDAGLIKGLEMWRAGL